MRTELDHIPNPTVKASIEEASWEGWLLSRPIENLQLPAVLESELYRGEVEAIAFSTEMEADLLLIDEKEGRVFARQAKLRVRGVLGVAAEPLAHGWHGGLKVPCHRFVPPLAGALHETPPGVEWVAHVADPVKVGGGPVIARRFYSLAAGLLPPKLKFHSREGRPHGREFICFGVS